MGNLKASHIALSKEAVQNCRTFYVYKTCSLIEHVISLHSDISFVDMRHPQNNSSMARTGFEHSLNNLGLFNHFCKHHTKSKHLMCTCM